ncbi:PREDICTED: receptor tyrosine-protein kinase erbB-4-like [Branchiostoma belcheri]|uniref:Receptor tyrosine-protein kinase erbB-4-like n=1 Tax=Branchiostoma belcheri TaxID=7741 RepID=A0A6P5A1S6_BRABE|nr:PREDICTED: receptor tyrosine-protein kinase erbB-4-like [Branchiostoma belcheri]
MSVTNTAMLLLGVCSLLGRASEHRYTVSVPENTKPGTDVVSLPSFLGTEKAELPCVMVEGDPHGRFEVSTNCTIVVARPLDWSVQSEYLLKIRVGQLQDTSHRTGVVSLQIIVTSVPGYPPVYNETCEPPVRHSGDSDEFLFSLGWSAQLETTGGDVLFAETVVAKPRERWDMNDPSFAVVIGSNCDVHIVVDVHNIGDMAVATEWWVAVDQGHHSERNSKILLSCYSESVLSELFLELFHLGSKDNVHYLRQYVPQVMAKVKRTRHKLMYLLSSTFQTKTTHYNCKSSPLRRPVRFSSKLPGIRNFGSVTVDMRPIGCPPGKYGFFCDKTCICENGARCHGFNGACKCTPGWQGVACDIPKPGVSATTTPSDSSDIYISANVTIHCNVHHLSVTTLSLRLPDGSEIVSNGANHLDKTVTNIGSEDKGPYTCLVRDTGGNVFNVTIVLDIANCPPNRKGEFCDETCACLRGASCDWRSGCVCPPGWTGDRCQTTCPNGTYGERCRQKCRCRNGASCRPSDGGCTCTAGWYGSFCDVRCPRHRHGFRCQEVCTCKNNATCDNVDGSCTCLAPWKGNDCDEFEIQAVESKSLVEILVPLGSVIALVVCVAIVVYKKRPLCGETAAADGEAEALLELEQVQTDLAQTVQPGWLRRWETSSRHLTLGHLVGMGMFGHVIRAKLKTSTGEIITIAAKAVRRKDTQCYRNFYKEAAILVAVHEDEQHDNLRSNIIQLLGLVNEASQKYILMEYASNGNLLSLLRQTRRQNGAAASLPHHLRYAIHVARALQELQHLAITHCDVAARNVLITADDVAKLADFGLARDVYATVQHVTDDAHRREQRARRDNPAAEDEVYILPLNWMSPESLETGEYTCQSDVWSFGVLLWEIAAQGREPHYDGNNNLSCFQLSRTLRTGIRLRRPPECSGDIYDVMSSCWQERPPERPDPDALEERLQQVQLTMIPRLPFEIIRETAV